MSKGHEQGGSAAAGQRAQGASRWKAMQYSAVTAPRKSRQKRTTSAMGSNEPQRQNGCVAASYGPEGRTQNGNLQQAHSTDAC
jgi:hypothetical protein